MAGRLSAVTFSPQEPACRPRRTVTSAPLATKPATAGASSTALSPAFACVTPEAARATSAAGALSAGSCCSTASSALGRTSPTVLKPADAPEASDLAQSTFSAAASARDEPCSASTGDCLTLTTTGAAAGPAAAQAGLPGDAPKRRPSASRAGRAAPITAGGVHEAAAGASSAAGAPIACSLPSRGDRAATATREDDCRGLRPGMKTAEFSAASRTATPTTAGPDTLMSTESRGRNTKRSCGKWL
mmetsp:Transcript_95360/g.307771  ORF Transcript_95360/g.307771 Transcript_95360/m.307771 type:complete len:245 (-) Transcript_95360:6-740(-)